MADRIPSQYVTIVKNSLVAAAAIAPAGLLGGIDAVGVGATWTTMLIELKNKAGVTWSCNPKRICVGVASGLARYYLGCKAAVYMCFLIPGVGPFATAAAAIGISGVCNIYFTYSFAAGLIELYEKAEYCNEDMIKFFLDHLKKLPTASEVMEIARIYRS